MLKNNIKRTILAGVLGAVALTVGCRYDMQDQPRYEYYEKSEFFSDELASRPLVEGTVPRGYLREDRALYTGKKDNAQLAPEAISSSGGKQQTQDGTGGQLKSTGTPVNATYPDAVTEFPLPVTAELIQRGQERYNVFCVVCHGPNGNGDGMIARRGYEGVKTYHTEELRNAPVGHFYDVITNGWGRMNGYAAQIPVADRWAIVAYIRTLQASQNPDVVNPGATQQNQQTTGAKAQNQPNSQNGAKN
jgi:mono/diheme cytochrome c family protein